MGLFQKGLEKTLGGTAEKTRGKVAAQVAELTQPGETIIATALARTQPRMSGAPAEQVAFVVTDRGLYLCPRSPLGKITEMIPIPQWTRRAIDREKRRLTIDYFHPDDPQQAVVKSHEWQLGFEADVAALEPHLATAGYPA